MIAKMKRREFITLLGGATAWPLAARGQQPERLRRIGVLIGVSGPAGQARAAALVQGLGALNWHEGRNLRIDWRWAGGDTALYERYAAELVSLHPDVLLAQGSLPITLLRRHTSTIPIVFTIVADPLGQGFVETLARPGGNITGFSSFDPQMTGKWLEMLTQISPPVARAAVLFDPKTALYAGLMLREIEQAARSLAVAVRAAPCSDARARRARWAVGSAGSVRRYTSPRHYCPRCPLPPGSSVSHPRVRRVRRDDVLWDRQYRCGPPSG